MVTACRSGSHRDSCPCWEHSAGPGLRHATLVSPQSRKRTRILSKQDSRTDTRSGKTDLKAGLPRGLQGMLQGLAEEVIGDGRP